MLSFLFLLTQISAQQPCVNSAFADLTNLTFCQVIARQNLPCNVFHTDSGIKYFYMSCDGSTNYDLPAGIDGGTTTEIQTVFQDLMANLSALYGATITVNCATTSHTSSFEVGCHPNGIRNYNVLTCNITAPINETLPEFPEYMICSGYKYSVSALLVVAIIFFFL